MSTRTEKHLPKASPRFGSTLRIGTAGWANPQFEHDRRPAGVSHLEHYAALFNSVEINSSFYRSHQRATYIRWRDATPASFRFSVKLPRSITHDAALRKCRAEMHRFLAEVDGLGKKLSVILVQLPPAFEFEARVATSFFGNLATASKARVACEPRHTSWFTRNAEELLKRHGVARVAADPGIVTDALLPGGAKRLEYYRLHGSPRMYYSSYSAGYLAELRARIQTSDAGTKETWCVFDNTARHEAWPNALALSARHNAP